ncbi:MAG: hypothetical protein M1828_004435 [Chrysothrix sp. TS-e1954]|nr:MAG: hypothetical protein M1828_004435 [Chrysothrix sp. TS-e1954]
MPVYIARIIFWFLDLFTNLEAYTWDDKVVDSLMFLQHSVLQVPFFLMSLMKFITPALDNMFMESLDWVDRTYVMKHQSEDPSGLRAMYYPTLREYENYKAPRKDQPLKQGAINGITAFLVRYGRKAGFSLAIYLLTFVPYVGKLVLPAVSFYYFNNAVGPKPAIAIFASGLVLPKRYLVRFLQTYFSSRSLMRELLDPYFSRIHFSRTQKKHWFLDREGVLFGFGVGFFLMVKIPLVGVLVYGIAEASTAYLITKITDPPPPPAEQEQFVESQVTWKNKNKFLTLPLDKLDANNILSSSTAQSSQGAEMPKKAFT